MKRLVTQVFPERQLELVLAALTPQNRRAMRVSLETGLRISDVLVLRPEQLDSSFVVKEGKTGKKKRVRLSDKLLEELKQQSGAYWVFPGRDPTKHRTRQAVWMDVKRASRAFRIPQNVAPHSMRKLYAVRLYKKYGDIDRVRRALNHDDLTTTLIYAMADKLSERL